MCDLNTLLIRRVFPWRESRSKDNFKYCINDALSVLPVLPPDPKIHLGQNFSASALLTSGDNDSLLRRAFWDTERCLDGTYFIVCLFYFSPWRRERLPTPVFWPGELHGITESDTTERLSFSYAFFGPWEEKGVFIWRKRVDCKSVNRGCLFITSATCRGPLHLLCLALCWGLGT